MSKTLFEKIADREIPAWIVWEDANHIAFLTPFANTPGVTVLCPKENVGDYVFDLSQPDVNTLMVAAKKVAKGLEKALNIDRVAVVFEGTGVAHLHAKLYPLHGKLGSATNVWPHHQEFYPEYLGYISTVEGPKMDDSKLDDLLHKIKKELD